jgi:hypothetical protein
MMMKTKEKQERQNQIIPNAIPPSNIHSDLLKYIYRYIYIHTYIHIIIRFYLGSIHGLQTRKISIKDK